MFCRLTVCHCAALFATIACVGRATADHSTLNADGELLFSYFVGNGEDGLHFLHSSDGYQWEPIAGGRSLLTPTAGGDKLMRDPCIVRGPDGRFHMVWTVSWNERGIGYASSDDLLNWSPQRFLPVMEHEPTARNCWAPEVFYDPATRRFLVFWATTIPGKYPETDGQIKRDQNDPGWDHRIYCTSTADFEAFAPTESFYEPGFNVIDSTLVQFGDRYAMILKDETDRPRPAEKNLRVAWADKAAGPYGKASPPITGKYWAEGPTAVRIGDKWFVYFDKYTEHKYGVVTSPDLEQWSDESDKLQMPAGVRHGTAFWAPRDVVEKLKRLP
ncbi:MAG: glycoside hydrolase family 43 protein [Pirellulales bacterium]|nr:glycoside hydrolase family 43 protein [Pirellulales bacterium]